MSRQTDVKYFENVDDASILQFRDQKYKLLGTFAYARGGRIMKAQNKEGELVAIKIIHRAWAFMEPEAKVETFNERGMLERVTLARKPFLAGVLACWEDEENIYFVMVRGKRVDNDNGHLHLSVIFSLFTMQTFVAIWTASGWTCPSLKTGCTSPSLCASSCPIRITPWKLTLLQLMAVDGLHSMGIVHRDIKPDNILISPSGHLALADFGFAEHWRAENEIDGVVGTNGYIAPEVVRMEGCWDYSGDVWSMGVLLYEMCMGLKTPYYGNREPECDVRVTQEDINLEPIQDAPLRDLLSKVRN